MRTMIRHRENPVMWQAGALSLLVHGALFLVLVLSFNWKSVAPMQVAEVQLWDRLPTRKTVPVPEPKIAPTPIPKVEPVPPPKPEPKADIQLKPKPPVKPKPEPKPKEAPPKPDPKVQAKKEEEKRLEELKRLMLEDDDPSKAQERETKQIDAARNAQAQAAAASSKEVDVARARIAAKIRQFVNPQVCGKGKPELVFAIALMPTGEVIDAPHLLKGSGIAACDRAVESAILQARPLPVPRDPELFAQLRDLNLKFRPNDDN